jgi:hypothetical protein
MHVAYIVSVHIIHILHIMQLHIMQIYAYMQENIMHICKKIFKICKICRLCPKYAKYALPVSPYLAADSESALMTPGPAAAAAACQGRTKSFWPFFGHFIFVSKVIQVFAGPLPPAGGSATRAKTQAGKNSATCDSDHRHVTAESDSHGDRLAGPGRRRPGGCHGL